jgi:hypothetical protein
MEDLKITIHKLSCTENGFSGEEFIKILKAKLVEFNPSFFLTSEPRDAYYPSGFSIISAVNILNEEQQKIENIIKQTFENLININRTTK